MLIKTKLEQLENNIKDIVGHSTEMACTFYQKQKISQAIAQAVRQIIPKESSFIDAMQLQTLKMDGIVRLDNLSLSTRKINSIVRYFKQIPVFGGHVPAQSDGVRRYLDCGAKQDNFGSYSLEDSLNCPYLVSLAFHPTVLSLVEEYLGCTPIIYSMNTWWSFPGFAIKPGQPQDYHRDVDDFNFLALFIYLTDVKGGEHGGQHRFIKKTHDEAMVANLLNGDQEAVNRLFLPELKNNGYGQSEYYERVFKNEIVDITGPAGSVFLADTFALHKGVPPCTQERLVCWIRYGLRADNLTYGNDKTKRIPSKILKNSVPRTFKNQYILSAITTDELVQPPVYSVLSKTGQAEHIELVDFVWKKEQPKWRRWFKIPSNDHK